MARSSVGPWFYKAKNVWCIEHFGKRISLKVKGIDNEAEAIRAWHRFQADGVPTLPTITQKIATVSVPVPTVEVQRATVKTIADAFTAAKLGTIQADTHYHYRCLLKRVTAKFGKDTAEELKPGDFLAWLNTVKGKSGKTFSASHRSDIAGVLMTAYRWAELEGKLIMANPLKSMKKPAGESRGSKSVITPETHRKIMKAVSPELRDLLTVLHSTGARPSEITRLQAVDVDFANGIATLVEHKTAGKTGKPRHIILPPDALAILKRRAKVQPLGALLKNPNGSDWKKDTIVQAMRRASKRAGVKVTAYDFRHTFATDCLSAGTPDAVVSALLGHTGTAMLHRHYSHLTSQTAILKAAAARVRG
jgi:integrase